MLKIESTSNENRLFRKAKLIVRREVPALFIGAAMVSGAMIFCIIVGEHISIEAVDLKWVALVGALNGLPRAYAKLKNKREPIIILFARAFREGFSSPASIAPDLSKLFTKMRGLWRNLKKGI